MTRADATEERSLGELGSAGEWSSYWQGRKLAGRFPLYPEFRGFLPNCPGASFLEIGCSPGRILAEICADRGYEAFGLDFAADPAVLTDAFTAAGVKVGGIYQADFRGWDPGRRYDIVASFGFIEHFDEPDAILDRHFQLCAPGGTVVVTLPHFAAGQRPLRWLFDRPNLKRHNLACMNVPFLRRAGERNGAEILAARHAGGHFNFWVEPDSQPKWARSAIRRVARTIRALAGILPGDANPWFSPFLLAVYRLPPETPSGDHRGGNPPRREVCDSERGEAAFGGAG